MSELRKKYRWECGTWTTREGNRMPICAMTDSHLAFAIAKIERSLVWRKHVLRRLQFEVEIRHRRKDNVR